MPETRLTATIHASTADINADTWNRMLPQKDGVPDNPFVDHAFFLALEESGSATARTGWQAQHIELQRGGETVGLMPLFLKSHSQGEYVFDYGWADAFERAGGHYYPKLQCAVPFTPASAPKLLVPSDEMELQLALLSTAEQLASRRGASSVHATFMSEEETGIAEQAGWLVRNDTQFHWHNHGFDTYDAFLDTLASRKRKVLRRERREALADGLRVEWVTGSDLTEAHWDKFFEFYQDTGSRKWGRPYLSREFFSLISAAMADRIVLMFAYDGDEAIAGALNFLGNDTIFGRYWGCNRDVRFLHFELCYYQAIDFAIAHGLKTVEAGAQGEHKLARGYEPSLTRSVHWIENAGFRAAVEDYLNEERRSVAHNQDILDRFTPFRKADRQGER